MEIKFRDITFRINSFHINCNNIVGLLQYEAQDRNDMIRMEMNVYDESMVANGHTLEPILYRTFGHEDSLSDGTVNEFMGMIRRSVRYVPPSDHSLGIDTIRRDLTEDCDVLRWESGAVLL